MCQKRYEMPVVSQTNKYYVIRTRAFIVTHKELSVKLNNENLFSLVTFN
jgi:hypothetical protein